MQILLFREKKFARTVAKWLFPLNKILIVDGDAVNFFKPRIYISNYIRVT